MMSGSRHRQIVDNATRLPTGEWRYSDGTPVPGGMAQEMLDLAAAFRGLQQAMHRSKAQTARITPPRGGCVRRLLRLLDLVD